VLNLALFADEVSKKYQVQIIFTPQYVDVSRVAGACKNLLVFAQHMDSLPVGRGVGSVLPEAVKEAGAVGVLLNHAEKQLTMHEVKQTLLRADEVGLASMVCAGSLKEVDTVARMNPNIVLAEAPELIGTSGRRSQFDQDAMRLIDRTVREINPYIHVLHGAGIANEKDVYEIIALGAEATGSTSGIIKADAPFEMLERMIKATRDAWNITHP
jgi:triosephosphate isomerase